MSKQRVPLGLKKRSKIVPKDPILTPEESNTTAISKSENLEKSLQKTSNKNTPPKKGKGRPSTKKGKKLVKYSMDIHPELKRAVVKAAAINDKDVHVMWNEIIYDWFAKQKKSHPDWYKSINVHKSEL